MAGAAGMSRQDFSYIKKLPKSRFRQDFASFNSGFQGAVDGVGMIRRVLR